MLPTFVAQLRHPAEAEHPHRDVRLPRLHLDGLQRLLQRIGRAPDHVRRRRWPAPPALRAASAAPPRSPRRARCPGLPSSSARRPGPRSPPCRKSTARTPAGPRARRAASPRPRSRSAAAAARPAPAPGRVAISARRMRSSSDAIRAAYRCRAFASSSSRRSRPDTERRMRKSCSDSPGFETRSSDGLRKSFSDLAAVQPFLEIPVPGRVVLRVRERRADGTEQCLGLRERSRGRAR